MTNPVSIPSNTPIVEMRPVTDQEITYQHQVKSDIMEIGVYTESEAIDIIVTCGDHIHLCFEEDHSTGVAAEILIELYL